MNLIKRVVFFLFILVCSANITAQVNQQIPTDEQEKKWRRIANEEGQNTMVESTVKNFFRNKLIFLVIGGVVVGLGAISLRSKK
jgi:hypothetical protein